MLFACRLQPRIDSFKHEKLLEAWQWNLEWTRLTGTSVRYAIEFTLQKSHPPLPGSLQISCKAWKISRPHLKVDTVLQPLFTHGWVWEYSQKLEYTSRAHWTFFSLRWVMGSLYSGLYLTHVLHSVLWTEERLHIMAYTFSDSLEES